MKITINTLYRTILLLMLISIILMLYMIYNRNFDTNNKVTYIYNNFSWVICEENEKETISEEKK